MSDHSIDAYDAPDRVDRYDRDMDIMHPLRLEMVDVALDVLPFESTATLRALDLGTGTGIFVQRFLQRFPRADAIGVDGAASMVELAKARLGDLAQRVQWHVGDFRALPASAVAPETLDVVISSFALHHLDASDKREVLRTVIRALKPGGWLLNADLVVAQSPVIERRIQQVRVAAVTGRAPKGDERFATEEATRRHLDELEAKERDQPLTLLEDLRLLDDAGLGNVEVFWKEFREAVTGGCKPLGEACDG